MKIISSFLLLFLNVLVFGQVTSQKNPTDFIPKGFVLFEKITGDLNKDGLDDCVMVIKGTNKKRIITNEDGELLDRNRRGIIILFNKTGYYEQATTNYDCFSSENEDGGVYFAPELTLEIDNGNLGIHYGHGRYGYWKYTFRFQNNVCSLIGYDHATPSSFESDAALFNEESYNLLTKKKLFREVTQVTRNGKEVYKDSWEKITVKKLLKLSDIKDFDKLDIEQILHAQ